MLSKVVLEYQIDVLDVKSSFPNICICLQKRADKKQPQNVFMSHEDISLFLSVGSVSIFVQDELAQHFCHEDEGTGTGGRLA